MHVAMQPMDTTRKGRGADGLKAIQFWLERPKHLQLKVLAATSGRSIKDLVREAVEKYLEMERRAA